jgi:3-phenylpropionate/trans-cinnamate dioxygenase ferredoxin reductase component
MSDEHFVIVGGGQAAAQAVHTLRLAGFAGRVTLVGDEPWPPYQRPPLSKKYLAGALARERLYLRPLAYYQDKGVALELGVPVEHIASDARHIELADGRKLAYDRLMLTTGSSVRRLETTGAELAGVHYLRTLADVDALAPQLEPGRRLVIIGAGYIGLEVAAVAAGRGVAVTVLEATERVMSRVVGQPVSELYQARHGEAGVAIHCRRTVTALVGRARVEAVETVDGERFPCDVALVGIGIVPRAELAEGAGLACSNGILVDELACTEDPSIVAAGDCTNHPNALLGRRLRLESVHNAIEQAKTAALTMIGQQRPYADVPWFWSDQYDLKLQIAGISAGHDAMVLRGDPESRCFAAFYLAGGRLIAVDAINRPREFMHGKQLIAARAEPDPGVLENPDADLGALVRRSA